MKTKPTYFRQSTVQQRKLLFETWQATGSVKKACAVAHMSRGAFYWWKGRFEEQGYAGLEQTHSRRPKHFARQKSSTLEAEVKGLRQTHADWGKRRIADELAKAHNWVPLVSPNTVKRILHDAGLWAELEEQKKTTGPRSDAARNKMDRP
jgi:transposase